MCLDAKEAGASVTLLFGGMCLFGDYPYIFFPWEFPGNDINSRASKSRTASEKKTEKAVQKISNRATADSLGNHSTRR
jgi:hypothetical protein